MSDWDYSVDTTADTDPSGYDSWNTYDSISNPNAFGMVYDRGGDGFTPNYTFSGNSDFNFDDYISGNSDIYSSKIPFGQTFPETRGGFEPSWQDRVRDSLKDNPDKWLGGLFKGMAGLEEKRANRGRADMLNRLMRNGMLDPAAQMRTTAMNQFDQAVADPMSVPVVRQQIDAMTQAQRIKDAQAGRRSNNLLGDTQVLGQAGKVINDYLANMGRVYSPPQAGTLAQLGMDAAKYGNTGNAPIYSAIGSTLTNYDLNRKLEQLFANR